MSEKRKKALVAYMAGLFGVAFFIVCISLSIQIKKNTLNATTAEKVIALQNEIQNLKDENKALEESNGEIRDQLSEVLEGFEYLEGIAYDATAKISAQERMLEISRMIIGYQQALISEDEQARLEYLNQLKEAAQDAESLDAELYETITTIMENESETDE